MQFQGFFTRTPKKSKRARMDKNSKYNLPYLKKHGVFSMFQTRSKSKITAKFLALKRLVFIRYRGKERIKGPTVFKNCASVVNKRKQKKNNKTVFLKLGRCRCVTTAESKVIQHIVM